MQRPFGSLGSDLAEATVSDVGDDRLGHVFVLVRRDSQAGATAPAVIELSPVGTRPRRLGRGDC